MQFTFDREYSLFIHNRRLSVIEWGDANAEPILCMHGWLDNAASFHYLAPLLKDKYRLIAFEMPGHGQSEHLSIDADYQFVSGISILDGVLDMLKIKKCKIIGHSMGAALSLIYAGVMPKRVSHLVSIDAMGPWTSESDETINQLSEAIENRKQQRGNKRYFEDIKIAAKARAQVSELTAECLMPLVERGVVLMDKGYQWSSDARLKNASWIRMSELQLEYILKNISAEFLLLQAKNGIINNIPIKERLALLANKQAFQMEGGHHFHMQYPEAVAEKVIDFFNA